MQRAVATRFWSFPVMLLAELQNFTFRAISSSSKIILYRRKNYRQKRKTQVDKQQNLIFFRQIFRLIIKVLPIFMDNCCLF